jgi:AraC-like DNA-binding protein
LAHGVRVSQRPSLLVHDESLTPGSETEFAEEGWRFCFVRDGVLYWLGDAQALELVKGRLLLVKPGARGYLRASQIEGASIRTFGFKPEILLGFFGYTERSSLIRLREEGIAAEVLPSDHPAAEIMSQLSVPVTLSEHAVTRAQLLRVALLALSGRIQGFDSESQTASSVQRRFQALMLDVSESDLLSRSPEEIAAMCGCSVRYLQRLFRSTFQLSLRAAQEEVRLRQALELVEQTGIRIADVARSVGYRHIGQFNAAFKRQFGHTPSECRINGSAAKADLSRIGPRTVEAGTTTEQKS